MSKVTTYYLEMLSSAELKAKENSQQLVVQECEIDSWQVNRFLYQYVGQAWQWNDKLSWNDAQWLEYVAQPSMRTWIGYWKGSIAGYFELQMDDEGSVEINYFGLASQFIGKGLGGYFLSQAIEKAWSFNGVKRVWVHTCSLDHPQALGNYQARGLRLYREEIEDL